MRKFICEKVIKINDWMKLTHLSLFIFVSFFVLLVLVKAFVPSIVPSSIDAGTIKSVNITFNNTDIKDATKVNITLPDNFSFIQGSNGTTSSLSNFSSSGNELSWFNSSASENISLNSNASFWFNVSVPKEIYGTYDFTVKIFNSTHSNSTNVSILIERTVWSEPEGEFYVKPVELFLNWSNAYSSNITLTVNVSQTKININNKTTGISGNYSQRTFYYVSGSKYATKCFYSPESLDNPLLVRNASGAYVNTTNLMSEGTSSEFTLIHDVLCPPGKYWGRVNVRNATNYTENTNITVTIDVPISTENELNESTGSGSFKGRMQANSSTYHSYYFNTSAIPNATGVTIELTDLSNDLDLFLFNYSSIKAKSIQKGNASESLTYEYLPVNETWEIRIFGNFTSSYDDYVGKIHFTTLNATNTNNPAQRLDEINFGKMNASQKKRVNVTLKNEGSLNLSNVKESKEIYHEETFFGSTAPKNFTVLIPEFATKVKASVEWSGASNYTLSLYKPDGSLVGSSTNKHENANVSKATQEEYVLYDSRVGWDDDGFWTVSITNNTNASFDPYTVSVKFWVNANGWINSNYTTQNFTQLGTNNATQSYHFNFTIPNDTMAGIYKGYLKYTSDSGAILEIPLEVNVTTPELIVNQSIHDSTVQLTDNIGFNRTLIQIIVPINNTGNENLTIDSTSNSTYLNYSTNYMEFTYSYPSSPIIPGSSENLTINISIDTSKTNNKAGIYQGWIYLNDSDSHPYKTFKLTIKVNLTDALKVNVSSIDTGDGNEVIENATSQTNVTLYGHVWYVNDTVEIKNLLLNNFTVWLTEENVSSYRVPTTGYLSESNATPSGLYNPANNRYELNVTIPANLPGGRYRIHVAADHYVNKVHLNGTKTYYPLIINNTGLFMSTNASSCSFGTSSCNPFITIKNGSSYKFYVNVSNFGPLAASSATITFSESCDGYSVSVTGSSSGCSASQSGSTFTISPSAYSTDCLVWWTITAGSSAASACTGHIIGDSTSNKWFNPHGINVTITISVPSTTTTTATTTITTTTIPVQEAVYLNITNYPSLVSVEQGKNNSVSVTVKNINDTIDQSVSLTILNLTSSWYTVNPSSALITHGSSKNFNVTFKIPENASIQDHLAKFKAWSSYGTNYKSFTLRVLPGAKLQVEIVANLSTLRNETLNLEKAINQSKAQGYDVSEAENLLNQTKLKLKQALNYLNQSDYRSAYFLLDDIENLLNQTKEALIKATSQKGFNVWKWLKWVGIAIAIGGAGFLVYLLWPTPTYKPEKGYVYKRKKDEIREKIKEQAKKIKEKIKRKKKGYQYKG